VIKRLDLLTAGKVSFEYIAQELECEVANVRRIYNSEMYKRGKQEVMRKRYTPIENTEAHIQGYEIAYARTMNPLRIEENGNKVILTYASRLNYE
jgi:hypothetical protein